MTFDILIPVFNALADLQNCLESVLKFTDSSHQILLLDDASTDVRVADFLRSNSRRSRSVQVRFGSRNVGYLKNVNAGLQLCKNDVILLNSDTVVSEGWLDGLVRAQRSRDNVGIVSPLLTEGAFLSFPHAQGGNRFVEGETFYEMAKRLRDTSPRLYPEIPAAIGSCMLITRKVVESIGYLEVAFSPGYWEEIDYSLRARAAGFKVVCADDVYVYHRGGASFSTADKTALHHRNQRLLDILWPRYFDELRSFVKDDPFHEHASKFRSTPP